MPSDRELAALKFLDGLGTRLSEVRDPQKALRHALRDTREFFHATHGCIATLQAGRPEADLLFALPQDGAWDLDLLARFIRNARPPAPRDILLAPLRRRRRAWGAIALVRTALPYDRHEGRLFTRIAGALSDAIHRIDRERIVGVRDRIDRKIMEQIDPKDLFYQILDGLRSLTQYDHSSALLIRDEGDAALRLVAEQIAWAKARSQRIGLRLPMAGETAAMLQSEQVYGFDRHDDGWREWNGRPAAALADLLDYNKEHPGLPAEAHSAKTASLPAEALGAKAGDGENVREASMLCAPLVTRDGLIGVLKIAARYPGELTSYDAELVEHFRSQAAVAIQNLHRTESLRARVLTAERKHAMAELARSVSHDVNNALGAMLPLVQQMQEDLRGGALEPGVLRDDLEQVQRSLQVCRRIFGGMLSFARGAARRSRHGQVKPAIDTVSAILKYGIARRGIELSTDLPPDVPAVACGQSDLEQVLLNVLTNAREATPDGGCISVGVRATDAVVEIFVADTGCGIPADTLPRVLEPFFTTKPHGNGLGLSICRSILWEIDGVLRIESQPGSGTRVHITLPQAPQAQPAHAS